MEIKVKSLETAFDIVKDFIQTVITPPLEEVGLLFSDSVRFWRFKNQVKIVSKAERYLKENNIRTKKVSLKILAPLLEHCSLEEEETLQEKWTALLVNIVDEKSTITNTLFSHILSELTKEDAIIFEIISGNCTIISNVEGKQIRKLNKNAIMPKSFPHFENKINVPISLDNLIRLRLIKEIKGNNMVRNAITVTDLGLSFINACTLT